MRIGTEYHRFVERIGRGLYKPCRKFLRDSLQGIIMRKSVMLSEIGRSLHEDQPLKATENRLSNPPPKNAIQAPSGEKNGNAAPSVPAMGSARP